ncbi:MAG: hypothetical protein ACYS99_21985 [Planctomycetota bacterium]|jgi:hypothetical protein
MRYVVLLIVLVGTLGIVWSVDALSADWFAGKKQLEVKAANLDRDTTALWLAGVQLLGDAGHWGIVWDSEEVGLLTNWVNIPLQGGSGTVTLDIKIKGPQGKDRRTQSISLEKASEDWWLVQELGKFPVGKYEMKLKVKKTRGIKARGKAQTYFQVIPEPD